MQRGDNMPDQYAAVVGGINMDICGKSFAPLIGRDSNPGAVKLSLGGVGRNIAHNLRLLDCPVRMLTALGEDLYARRVEEDCGRLGIDLRHAVRVPGGATSTYLAIEGPEGDMELAICDDALAKHITPAYLAEQSAVLNGAAAVAVDTNLTPEALQWLAENCAAPIFADPVSVTKAEKLRPLLGRLFLLKPNRIEAELLSGVRITDRRTLEEAADKLLSTGLKRVCISLGSEGVFCAWGAERCLVPCLKLQLVNASGGGDAMMAGFLRAFLDGLPIEPAARFALACSAIAVEGAETINPALTLAYARKRAVGAVSGRPENPNAGLGPERRRNRLKTYDYSQGGAYHVVICTDQRKCILSEVYEGEDTQQLRLFSLGRLVEEAILAIPAHYPTVEVVRYSVMPNHVHLLLRLSTEGNNPTVSWVINQLKGIVTKRSGKQIWQKGFYDQVIRSESDFRSVGEYIEYNPAKWKTDDYYVSPL